MTRYTLSQLINALQDKSFSFYKVPKHIAKYFGMSTAYTLAGIIQHWQTSIEEQGHPVESMPISNKKMMEISGTSKGTLRKILRKLEALGVLKISGDGKRVKRQITLKTNTLGDLYLQSGSFAKETIHQWQHLFHRKIKRPRKTDHLALNKENMTLRHINGELFDFYRVPVALVASLGIEVTHTFLFLCDHWGTGVQKEYMQVQMPVLAMKESLSLDERSLRRHVNTLTGNRLLRVEYKGCTKTCFYEINIRSVRGVIGKYNSEFVLENVPRILNDLDRILAVKYRNIRTKIFQGSKMSDQDNHAGLRDWRLRNYRKKHGKSGRKLENDANMQFFQGSKMSERDNHAVLGDRDMTNFSRNSRTITRKLERNQNISDISSDKTNILREYTDCEVLPDSHDSGERFHFANANRKETILSPHKENEERKERKEEKSPYNPLKEEKKQSKEANRNPPLPKKKLYFFRIREEFISESECNEDEHMIPSLDGYPIQDLKSKSSNEETLKNKNLDLTPAPAPAPSKPLTRSLGLHAVTLQPNESSDAVFTVENFPAFYDRYPRKVHRAKALSAWLKLNKRTKALRPTVSMVLSALEKYRAFCQSEKLETVLIKHPSTFLNSGSWDGIDDNLQDLKLIMTANKTKYRPIEPSPIPSIVLDEKTLRNALYDYDSTMDGDYQSLNGLRVEAVHALASIFQEFQSRLKWRSKTEEPYCHRWINVPKSLGEFIRYFGAWLRMQTWIDVTMKTLSSVKIMERWAADLSKDCGYSIFTGD